MPATIDVLIAGAGFAGLVLAQRLSESGLKCVVLERRNHFGGNAYDAPDENGVLYHRYGPHYFRTNSRAVRDYLSRFTTWQAADYRIKSHTHGQYWSFPVNLATYEQLMERPATEAEFIAWLAKERVPTEHPQNSEEVILANAGPTFYNLFFKGYTLKQWDRHPRDLDPSVCARIPVRTTRDDHYLREEFQALPSEGFTRLFQRMIEASPGIEVHLDTDFHTARHHYEPRHTIYTGPIDAYFDTATATSLTAAFISKLKVIQGNNSPPKTVSPSAVSPAIGNLPSKSTTPTITPTPASSKSSMPPGSRPRTPISSGNIPSPRMRPTSPTIPFRLLTPALNTKNTAPPPLPSRTPALSAASPPTTITTWTKSSPWPSRRPTGFCRCSPKLRGRTFRKSRCDAGTDQSTRRVLEQASFPESYLFCLYL